MAINFGGYNQLGANIQQNLQNTGSQLGGLLGNVWGDSSDNPEWMTDDKGLFQGGKYGRTFGRIKDALGMAPTQAYDVGPEEALKNQKFYDDYHANLDDEYKDWDWDDKNLEYEDDPVEDDPVEDGSVINSDNVLPGQNRFASSIPDNQLSVSNYGNPNSAFASTGLTPNTSWGGGMGWMQGYDPKNTVHNSEVLANLDDQTKNLYGGGPVENPIEVTGGNKLSFSGSNTNYDTSNPAYVNALDYTNSLLGGIPGFNSGYENTNPSSVDTDLMNDHTVRGQGWNTGGNRNWRGI